MCAGRNVLRWPAHNSSGISWPSRGNKFGSRPQQAASSPEMLLERVTKLHPQPPRPISAESLLKCLKGKHPSTASLHLTSRLHTTKNQDAAFVSSAQTWQKNEQQIGLPEPCSSKGSWEGFFFLLAFPPLYLSYADTQGRWGRNKSHVKFWKIFSHMKVKRVVWVFVKKLLKACFPVLNRNINAI